MDFTGPDGWDPSLIGVMGGGVIFNGITFHLLHKHEVSTIIQDKSDQISLNNVIKMWKHPANTTVTSSFVLGAAMFGVGWGMCGVCPGPGIVNLGASSQVSAAYIPPLLVGMACHEVVKSFHELKKRIRRGNTVSIDCKPLINVEERKDEGEGDEKML